MATEDTSGGLFTAGPAAPDEVECGRIPTIVDNRNDNSVLSVLQRLVPCSVRMDVATGTFEIGSLLELHGLWQELRPLRLVSADSNRAYKPAEIKNLKGTTNEQ